MYLFGHSGFLLNVLLFNGNQRSKAGLHLRDETHRQQQMVRINCLELILDPHKAKGIGSSYIEMILVVFNKLCTKRTFSS